MAVQEALILPLRAAPPTSGFTEVSPRSLSLSQCVCVSELPSPCLLSPPLSLIPLSGCLSRALLCASLSFSPLYESSFLALSALPFPFFLASLLVLFTSPV